MPAPPVHATAPQRSTFSSRNEDEVTEFIRQTYVGNRLRFSAAADSGARFVTSTGDAQTIAADRSTSTVDYSIDLDPFDFLLFISVDRGRLHVSEGPEERITLPGQSTMYPLGVSLRTRVSDISLRTIRLPLTLVSQIAEETSGIPASAFRFESALPVSPVADRWWRDVMSLATGVLLDHDSPADSTLVLDELLRMVALSALHTFPNTTMGADPVGRAQVANATLRRAVDFIDEHAHQPVSLTEIAGAAGLSARALQYAFRRHYDTTPMGYLRRVRLHQAHRDLQAADPSRGDTVAAVARRWGFSKPNRFAATYHATYGVAPDQTLGR